MIWSLNVRQVQEQPLRRAVRGPAVSCLTGRKAEGLAMLQGPPPVSVSGSTKPGLPLRETHHMPHLRDPRNVLLINQPFRLRPRRLPCSRSLPGCQGSLGRGLRPLPGFAWIPKRDLLKPCTERCLHYLLLSKQLVQQRGK